MSIVLSRLGLRGHQVGLAPDAVIEHDDRATVTAHFRRFYRYAVYQVLLYAKYKHVSGKRYGTLSSEIDRIGRDGSVCILELELEGALKVQHDVPGSITIFIAADVDELERRLRERATESTGEIGERIALAREQLERAHEFRYMVRNDDLERATAALAALVECELEWGAVSRPEQHSARGAGAS